MTDPLDQLRANFSELWVREEGPHGQVFVGRDEFGAEVTVALLSQLAASDSRVRNAFADAVWQHSVGSAPDRATVVLADLTAARPWAATRNSPDQTGAERLLVDLPQPAPAVPPGQPGVPPPPGQPGSPVVPPPPGQPGSPVVPPPPPGTPPVPPPGTPPVPPYSPAAAPGSPGVMPHTPPGPPAYSPTAGPHSPGFPAYPPPGAPPAPPGFGPGSPGYPGGQPPYPPAGPPRRRALPWLITVSAGLAVVLVAVGSVVGWQLLRGGEEEPGPPLAGPTGLASPAPIPFPMGTPTPTPTEPAEPGRADRPELRSLPPVSVIGPTYSRTEETFTMAFQGWPFAFRTPMPWNCLGGTWEPDPDLPAWVCSGGAGTNQRVSLLLWECSDGCSETERQEMLEQWLDEPERAVRPPDLPLTYFVETEENDDGRYAVDLGHFASGPGEELRWLVGVAVESPPDTRDEVLKVMNDIVTQAG